MKRAFPLLLSVSVLSASTLFCSIASAQRGGFIRSRVPVEKLCRGLNLKGRQVKRLDRAMFNALGSRNPARSIEKVMGTYKPWGWRTLSSGERRDAARDAHRWLEQWCGHRPYDGAQAARSALGAQLVVHELRSLRPKQLDRVKGNRQHNAMTRSIERTVNTLVRDFNPELRWELKNTDRQVRKEKARRVVRHVMHSAANLPRIWEFTTEKLESAYFGGIRNAQNADPHR